MFDTRNDMRKSNRRGSVLLLCTGIIVIMALLATGMISFVSSFRKGSRMHLLKQGAKNACLTGRCHFIRVAERMTDTSKYPLDYNKDMTPELFIKEFKDPGGLSAKEERLQLVQDECWNTALIDVFNGSDYTHQGSYHINQYGKPFKAPVGEVYRPKYHDFAFYDKNWNETSGANDPESRYKLRYSVWMGPVSNINNIPHKAIRERRYCPDFGKTDALPLQSLDHYYFTYRSMMAAGVAVSRQGAIKWGSTFLGIGMSDYEGRAPRAPMTYALSSPMLYEQSGREMQIDDKWSTPPIKVYLMSPFGPQMRKTGAYPYDIDCPWFFNMRHLTTMQANAIVKGLSSINRFCSAERIGRSDPYDVMAHRWEKNEHGTYDWEQFSQERSVSATMRSDGTADAGAPMTASGGGSNNSIPEYFSFKYEKPYLEYTSKDSALNLTYHYQGIEGWEIGRAGKNADWICQYEDYDKAWLIQYYLYKTPYKAPSTGTAVGKMPRRPCLFWKRGCKSLNINGVDVGGTDRYWWRLFYPLTDAEINAMIDGVDDPSDPTDDDVAGVPIFQFAGDQEVFKNDMVASFPTPSHAFDYNLNPIPITADKTFDGKSNEGVYVEFASWDEAFDGTRSPKPLIPIQQSEVPNARSLVWTVMDGAYGNVSYGLSGFINAVRVLEQSAGYHGDPRLMKDEKGQHVTFANGDYKDYFLEITTAMGQALSAAKAHPDIYDTIEMIDQKFVFFLGEGPNPNIESGNNFTTKHQPIIYDSSGTQRVGPSVGQGRLFQAWRYKNEFKGGPRDLAAPPVTTPQERADTNHMYKMLAMTAVVENIINDVRMSVFGPYPGFQPLDFNGDNGFAIKDYTGGVEASFTMGDEDTYFSKTGRIYIGKQMFWRAVIRGQVWDMLQDREIAEANLYNVYYTHFDNPGAWNGGSFGRDKSKDHLLMQRWLANEMSAVNK